MSKFTPGPWYCEFHKPSIDGVEVVFTVGAETRFSVAGGQSQEHLKGGGILADECRANARLIAAAPTQHEEMLRYLPIIERAEADPELWDRLIEGTGIATANGYRAAIAKATGE